MYKYEVHMHTAQGSACGKTPAAEYIPVFKEQGYDGIIITDHFFHGNTAIDRSLPWEEFVDQYCRGYEEAKAEGDKCGLKVFFGWEECKGPDEYLIYGLDKQWLKDHPEILKTDHAEQYRLVHEAGGLVVGAHPFRERGYIDKVKLHPFQCDAMEVCNFGNPPYQDILAYNFCKDRNIIMTCGSDIHNKDSVYTTGTAMLFEKPLESIMDYVKAVKSGKGFTTLIPEDRRTPVTADIKNTLPMVYYDEHNEGRPVEISDLFGAF